MPVKYVFENTTALSAIDDIRAFLALVDGDGADDAAEAATGTGATAGGAPSRAKRKTKAEKEAEATAEAAAKAQAATGSPQPTFTPPGTAAAATDTAGTGQGGTPANVAFGQAGGAPVFGQAPNAAPAAVQLHPIAKAIIDVVDKSVAGGQPVENILTFFRPLIGPDAASATLDQIKQVFIPRMNEATLRQIAPQVGINVT